MKSIVGIFILLNLNQIVFAQQGQEIWGIGTKWTYEFNLSWDSNDTLDYAVVEITDTVTIDDLKLYVLNRTHSICNNTSYLHYADSKVYNYDTENKLLQLVFDFKTKVDYTTEYTPESCFGAGPDTNSVQLAIRVDSIIPYKMPDGSYRNMQYVNAINNFSSNSTLVLSPQRILDGIGFMDGMGFETHKWFVEEEFCDQFSCFPKHIRCFENDSIQYNFVGFPCDSILQTGTSNVPDFTISIYPNPTTNNITIHSSEVVAYELYSVQSSFISKGEITGTSLIEIPDPGVYFIILYSNERRMIKQIIKLE